MKFTIASKSLLKSVNQLNYIIDSNPLLPILSCFIFEVREYEVVISCSDSETFIKTTVALNEDNVVLDSDSSNKFAIPSKLLVETLRNIPPQPLTFEVDKDDPTIKMSIQSGDFKVAGDNPEDFPDFPIIDPESDNSVIAIDPDILGSAFKYTIFCAGNDELRPAMNGLCIDVKSEGECNFVATDAHRLALYKVDGLETTGEKTLILPNKSAKMIAKVLENAQNPDVSWGFNESYIAFNIAQTSVISRLIDESYPKYATVIPQDLDKKLVVQKGEIVGVLQMIQGFVNKSNNLVKLTIEDNTLKIVARDNDFGTESNQTLDCFYNAEKYRIGFNGKFLNEMFKILPSDSITLKFSDNSKPGMLVVDDFPELLMLLMPIIIDENED